MYVKNYSKSIQKKTERLLKKLFRYSNIKVALSELKDIKIYLEKSMNKDINDISIDDCKMSFTRYNFIKYRTLKKITDLYLDSVMLDNFIMKEYEEYVKCQ